MPSKRNRLLDPDKLPVAKRLTNAFEAWQAAKGSLSIQKAARSHGVTYSTLHGRINGAKSRKEDAESRQRLTKEEEKCLEIGRAHV